MEEKNISSVKRLREKSGLSRREVCERSGINLRSLQDYEQGHKNIASAKGETLYRLGLTLGCSMEELVEEQIKANVIIENRPWNVEEASQRRLYLYAFKLWDKTLKIEKQDIYCREYKIHGRWELWPDECNLCFTYKGETVKLPFDGIFSEETLPWLADAAELMIEDYISGRILEEHDDIEKGVRWNESGADFLSDAQK